MVDGSNSDEVIEVKLGEVQGTRQLCTVCGGVIDKFEATAVAETKHGTLRVCARCLKAGDLDGRLEQNACYYEQCARDLRELKGRLRVPTYQEWAAFNESENAVYEEALKRDCEVDSKRPKARSKFRYSGRPRSMPRNPQNK